MPLIITRNNLKVYIGDNTAEKKFRAELSVLLKSTFGIELYTQLQIKEILKVSLNYYIQEFTRICHNETAYYFYQSVLMFHEDAVEIAVKHSENEFSDVIPEGYLPTYRRILKFIIELACEVPMEIIAPTANDRQRIEKILDDLLFLGDMILTCVSLYSEQSMIEDVAEVNFDKNGLYVFSRRHHYNHVFDYISELYGYFIEKSAGDENGIQDLFKAFEDCFGIKYKDIGHIIGSIHDQNKSEYEGFNWDALPSNLERLFGVPYSVGELFFKGLTLDKHSKMSLLDLSCKPYNINRYLYKPIIIWNVNGKDFAFLGKNVWTESMIQFATNAIPWAKVPKEWVENRCFKKYVHKKEDQHDKWLDDEVENILMKENCLYSRNIRKLRTPNGYENFDTKGLGEVDFIIVSHDTRKILIVDCKHLQSRYDPVNQRNDFNAFTIGPKKGKSYNETMSNKVKWFTSNQNLLQYHFDCDISRYSVEGIFIVNTPTLYMFNSEYRIYTVNQLASVLKGTFKDRTFIIHQQGEDGLKLLKINYPYFQKPKYLEINDIFE